MTTITTDPTQFKGYPVELLRGLSGMGKALIGDDALFAAVEEYNSTTTGGAGVLGPALLTEDASVTVRSIHAHDVPVSVSAPVVRADTAAGNGSDDPWDAYSLDGLLAKAKEKGVEVPGRVKTPGKIIAALTAAGVTP